MSEALWTSAEAVAATGGDTPRDWTATGVSIDTRTLQPGDLFVALKAARDGHDFVQQALDKGAAAALVSRVPEGVDSSAPLLLVNDVQAGLEALGKASRARTRAQVVAVTGSVGKTSTKEMLRATLDAHGSVHAAEKSYNNHWGVPLTLARMPRDADFAVIEIGMNHPGEIAPLARMARPHVALITTVAPRTWPPSRTSRASRMKRPRFSTGWSPTELRSSTAICRSARSCGQRPRRGAAGR
ncbi:hypothetical protein KU6B_36330 [Mameliella alba]|nr:hypothetical protein KU6B_36330 [Mameliella alba]